MSSKKRRHMSELGGKSKNYRLLIDNVCFNFFKYGCRIVLNKKMTRAVKMRLDYIIHRYLTGRIDTIFIKNFLKKNFEVRQNFIEKLKTLDVDSQHGGYVKRSIVFGRQNLSYRIYL